MKHRTRHILLTAALGSIPALIAVGALLLMEGPPSSPTVLLYAAIVLAGMVSGVLVLWLIPALLFSLLPRLGILHARVFVFKGMSLLAIFLALSPIVLLLLLAFKLGTGACPYPLAPADGSLCHQLRLAGTWGFALSVPAGGFIVLLGLLMVRLSAMDEDGGTVAQRAVREGLGVNHDPADPLRPPHS